METEKELREAWIMKLTVTLPKADWYYEYIDDPGRYRVADREMTQIKNELLLLTKLEGGLEEARKLWTTHCPPKTGIDDGFLKAPNSSIENLTLHGTIHRKDSREVYDLLSSAKDNGFGYVVFQKGNSVITKDSFTIVETGKEGRTLADQLSTEKAKFILRPIEEVMFETKKIMEPENEKAMKEIASRLRVFEAEQKSSRDRGLSF